MQQQQDQQRQHEQQHQQEQMHQQQEQQQQQDQHLTICSSGLWNGGGWEVSPPPKSPASLLPPPHTLDNQPLLLLLPPPLLIGQPEREGAPSLRELPGSGAPRLDSGQRPTGGLPRGAPSLGAPPSGPTRGRGGSPFKDGKRSIIAKKRFLLVFFLGSHLRLLYAEAAEEALADVSLHADPNPTQRTRERAAAKAATAAAQQQQQLQQQQTRGEATAWGGGPPLKPASSGAHPPSWGDSNMGGRGAPLEEQGGGGLRQRRAESLFASSYSRSTQSDDTDKERGGKGGGPLGPAGRPPSVLRALASRHRVALVIFFLCAAVLIHGILTSINNPLPGLVRLETLEELAHASASRIKANGAHNKQGTLYLLGGAPIIDTVDWLDVRALGFEEVKRGNLTLGGVTFDPMLWDPALIDEEGNPKEPLQTNAWWTPLVVPPGVGDMHVVNSSPYLLSIRTKPRGRTDLVGDAAGLTIRGPILVLDDTPEGGTFGIRQSSGPLGFGFFIGIRLRDYGDEVSRHYVADPSPLSFEKVWEIKRFFEDENEMVDPTRVVTQSHGQSRDGYGALGPQKMRAFIVRGAPYVTLEVPPGQKLILETLPADTNAAKRNAIERISNYSGHPTEATHTCTSLMGKPMESDVFEVDLTDGTQWIAILDHKVQLTCEIFNGQHRLVTLKVLRSPLILRLGLASLCDHEIVKEKRQDPAAFPYLFYGAASLCPPDQAQGPGKAMFEKVFTRFALRDQLELISKSPEYGGFELVTLPWRPDLIASSIRDLSNPIDAIVIPDDFTRGSELGITGDLYYWLNVDFLSVRGKSLILTGGVSGEGRIKALLQIIFSIHVEHASTSTEDDGVVIAKMSQIYDTSPYEKDTGVPPIFRPENMPKQLRWPLANHEDPLDGHVYQAKSTNSIEYMYPQYQGWPFAPYCVRSLSPESCEKIANAFYYWGNGAISWLGMKWENDFLPLSEDWSVLLARSLRHGTCSEANRDGKQCAPLKKVLLIEPAAFTEQADFIRNAADLLLDREGELDEERVRSFLRGTRDLHTGNIGEPVAEVVDEEGLS
ncbi:hypothetical protein ACSSS7_006011 [Eimeria intestinalis]